MTFKSTKKIDNVSELVNYLNKTLADRGETIDLDEVRKLLIRNGFISGSPMVNRFGDTIVGSDGSWDIAVRLVPKFVLVESQEVEEGDDDEDEGEESEEYYSEEDADAEEGDEDEADGDAETADGTPGGEAEAEEWDENEEEVQPATDEDLEKLANDPRIYSNY